MPSSSFTFHPSHFVKPAGEPVLRNCRCFGSRLARGLPLPGGVVMPRLPCQPRPATSLVATPNLASPCLACLATLSPSSTHRASPDHANLAMPAAPCPFPLCLTTPGCSKPRRPRLACRARPLRTLRRHPRLAMPALPSHAKPARARPRSAAPLHASPYPSGPCQSRLPCPAKPSRLIHVAPGHADPRLARLARPALPCPVAPRCALPGLKTPRPAQPRRALPATPSLAALWLAFAVVLIKGVDGLVNGFQFDVGCIPLAERHIGVLGLRQHLRVAVRVVRGRG